MWNKIAIIVCIFIFGFCTVQAQSTSTKTNKTVKQKQTKKKQKQQKKSGMDIPGRYDPKVPELTLQKYKESLNRINEGLLEKKLSDELPEKFDKNKFLTLSECHKVLFIADLLYDNPELPEITKVRASYYKKVKQKLSLFLPVAARFERAYYKKSQNIYAEALKEFSALQSSCKAFLKEKPPKMTPDELNALKRKNTKMRLAKHNRLMRQLRALEEAKAKEAEAGANGKQTKNKK